MIKEKHIENEVLHDLLMKVKTEGKISNELGLLFMKLLNNLTSKVNYRNYPEDVKIELVGNAIINLCKYSHNYDASKSKSKTPAFNYVTRIGEMSFWATLNKYYKQVNLKKIIDEVTYEFAIQNLSDEDMEAFNELVSENNPSEE